MAIEITDRAGRDIPHHIATSPLRCAPEAVQDADDVTQMLGTYSVKLHILTRGDHELTIRIAQGHITDCQVLFSREPAAGNLQAHHVAFLLLVDPKMLQTLRIILTETCLAPIQRSSDPTR